MCGRPDFHRFLCDIDVGQLFELVIHARQFAFDVFCRVWDFRFDPGDIEKHAAMGLPLPSLISRTMQRET